jgi:cell division protein FtsN
MPEAVGAREVQPLPLVEAEADRALLQLEQALHRREALVIVAGRRGRAHSSLVRTALARFDEAYVVVLISPAHAEPIVAIDRLLETTGAELPETSEGAKKAALGRLIDRACELGRPVVVVIDDAQLATIGQLERLRIALNIHPGSKRPVQLVLAGTAKLLKKLKRREARGLWTRVSTVIEVDGGTGDGGGPRPTRASEPAGRVRPKARRPWLTLASAAVLVAAIVVIAAVSRRDEPAEQTATLTNTGRIDARPVGARVADPTVPRAAPGEPAPAAGQPSPAQQGGQPLPPVPESAERVGSPGPQARGPAVGSAGAAPAAEPRAPAAAPGAAPAGGAAERGAPAQADQGALVAQGASVTEGVEVLRGQARNAGGGPVKPQTAPADRSPAELAAAPGGRRAARIVSVGPNDEVPTRGERRRGDKLRPSVAAGPRAPSAAARAAASSASPTAPAAATRSAETPAVPVPSSAPSSGLAVGQAGAETAVAAAAPTRTASGASAARRYELQVGAFRRMANAAAVKDGLAAEFPATRIDQSMVGGAPFYRVRIGPLTSSEAAQSEKALADRGIESLRVPIATTSR